jgi:hypothetical protein
LNVDIVHSVAHKVRERNTKKTQKSEYLTCKVNPRNPPKRARSTISWLVTPADGSVCSLYSPLRCAITQITPLAYFFHIILCCLLQSQRPTYARNDAFLKLTSLRWSSSSASSAASMNETNKRSNDFFGVVFGAPVCMM